MPRKGGPPPDGKPGAAHDEGPAQSTAHAPRPGGGMVQYRPADPEAFWALAAQAADQDATTPQRARRQLLDAMGGELWSRTSWPEAIVAWQVGTFAHAFREHWERVEEARRK